MIRPLLVVLIGLLCVSPSFVEAADVQKTNSQKLYMHYMPWFETPYSLGANNWGWHWTMNTQNPNNITYDANYPDGKKRDIASHYYPLIGPYDSSDPDVIEYHLLLMKLSGVDGVLIDWYGVQGTNGDITSLLNSSNALIEKMDDFGMEFAVVMEDRFSANISQAEANVAYLRDNYFNNSQYIRLGSGDDPLLMSFGPITFQQEWQWTQILAQAGEDVNFLPLWYESGDAGVNADGEYSWVYEDESLDNYASHLSNFYQYRAPNLGVAAGSAFPGFDDFYTEGGAGGGYFNIPHDDGQTLATTLNLAGQYASEVDFLQLVTWNDFGEGTIFEPTVETGYDYLLQLQDYSGTPYGQDELELVHALYLARKEYAGNTEKQNSLDEVASLLAALDIDGAQALLNIVNGLALEGDLDGDGFVGLNDLDIVLNNWNQVVVPFGDTRADPSGDGFVGLDDLDVVLNNWNAGTPPTVAAPEPGSGLALLLLGVSGLSGRLRTR